MAGHHLGDELQRHPHGQDPPGRNGTARAFLGSLHRDLRTRLLYRSEILEMEERPVCRRVEAGGDPQAADPEGQGDAGGGGVQGPGPCPRCEDRPRRLPLRDPEQAGQHPPARARKVA